MQIRSLVAAGLLAAVTFFSAIPPASAAADGATDPIGDSNSSFADITTVVVSYSDATIGLGLSTRNSWSPATWTDGDAIIWALEVTGDNTEDYDVIWTPSGASVVRIVGGDVDSILCSASTSFESADDLYIAVFPASCIGTPASVRVQGYITLGYTDAFDFAPSHNTFTPFVSDDTAPPPPPPSDPVVVTAGVDSGYWMISEGGEVFAFGGAPDLGDIPAMAIDLEPTPSMNGYWVLAKNGNIFTKGDAPYFGNASLQAGEDAASLSATPSGKGYSIFTNKGRVIALGDAGHFGDMGGVALNGPVLDSVSTPSGKGYWMVGSDGGIFAFGDAKFSGSTGDLKLNKPVMSMAPDPDGSGYWLVASDGGIFAFDAPFYGSMGSTPLNKPVSGMVGGPAGYLMVAEDGGIFAFGNVAFHGSLGSNPPQRPIVAVALKPSFA
jgi:hypothetical protein